MTTCTLRSGGGGGSGVGLLDRTAEDFPVVKKYRKGEDGSDFPTIIGKPYIDDGEAHPEIGEDDWDSVFQMFDITILQLGGPERDSAAIYGQIYFEYQYGVWKLYDRQKENAEIIDLPGSITLTPPIFGVSSLDRLYITFKMSGGLEGLNQHHVGWTPHRNAYDKVRTVGTNGPGWAMQASYMAFRAAILADMKIDLLNFETGEQIYGSITASYIDKESCIGPLIVFNKKSSDSVRVTEQELLPLARPFVAVPWDKSLNINVNLHTVSGASIACGTVSIWAESYGTWFGVLRGKGGKIEVRVKVDFCPYHLHKRTALAREVRYKVTGPETG